LYNSTGTPRTTSNRPSNSTTCKGASGLDHNALTSNFMPATIKKIGTKNP
jgi:hypothetical protein